MLTAYYSKWWRVEISISGIQGRLEAYSFDQMRLSSDKMSGTRKCYETWICHFLNGINGSI